MEPNGPVNPTEPTNEGKPSFGARLKSLFTAKPAPEPPALTEARQENATDVAARQDNRDRMLADAAATTPVLDPEEGRRISSQASGENPVIDVEKNPTPPAAVSPIDNTPTDEVNSTYSPASATENTETDKVA